MVHAIPKSNANAYHVTRDGKVKVLIAYASAGAGHFKAAEAIYNYLKEYHPDIDVDIIDVLEKTNVFFRVSYKGGYSFLIGYAPLLWWWLFWLTDFKALRPFTRAVVSFFNRISTKSFRNAIIKEEPTYIISTHFLSSEIFAYLIKTEKIKSNLITVITDFVVHPFWVSSGTHIYIVASGFTKEELLLCGVTEDRIRDSGIPINSKFFREFDRNALCKEFAIEENKFTVLIMTGSFGVGPLEEIVEVLYADVQILVVCAANKKLYARLKKRNFSNVKVFGFVDNPEELMAVSDIIITKPGGLTVSELINMELIPIFVSSIPGQEKGNESVLKKYGVGLSPRSVEEIKNMVLDFKVQQDKLRSLKDSIKKIKKPEALGEIYSVICQGSGRTSC